VSGKVIGREFRAYCNVTRAGNDRLSSLVWPLLAVAGTLYVALALFMYPNPQIDFPLFYNSTRALWEGRPAYDPVPVGAMVLRNLNAPHIHFIWLPLLLLGLEPARWIWRGLTAAGLIVGVTMAAKPVSMRWLSGATWSASTTSVLITGQIAGIMAPGVTGILLMSHRGRWTVVGSLVGVLVAIKLFLWPLVLWLVLLKQWRAVAASTISAVVVFALGIAWVGTAPYAQWLAALQAVSWESGTWNASIAGLTHRSLPEAVEPLVRWAAISAVIAFTVLRLGQGDVARQLVIVLSASLLLSPLGWIYYLGLMAGPLLEWQSRGNRWPAAAWALFCPPMLLARLHAVPEWQAVCLSSAYTIGVTGLWWAACTSESRDGTADSVTS